MAGLIENIGVVVASFSAIYGINQWRRELQVRRQYEIAEQVLTLSYESRDRIRIIRSPFRSLDEGSTRLKDPAENEKQTELLNHAHIVFERYEANRAPFNDLFALRYRFMALYGQDVADPIQELRKALNEIFVSANALPNYWLRQGGDFATDAEFEEHLAEMHHHQSIFRGTFTDRDEFDQRIERIIEDIEITCAKVIRPSPWWQSLLLGRFAQKVKSLVSTTKNS